MKKYTVTKDDGTTATIERQPGAIRYAMRIMVSLVIYWFALGLIWANGAFIVIGTIVCLIIESIMRDARRKTRGGAAQS